MGDDDKRVSKLYRKVMTSNEMKAFLILEKCDDAIKKELKLKLERNGSTRARDMLERLQNI
ncbi:hypothetical protein [Radiobacillus deserti]|uniref:hypothetical protein n=1 Tax=Radiobacillus deserti TaxID=2594883 RepID=UPI001E2E75AC|nr:hypothetical protein [Radiobacillus deserti]